MRSENRRPPRVGSPSDGPDLPPRFKLLFFSVVALTVLALVLDVLLALLGGSSEQAMTAADACSTTYKMGFGAIVALIGTKDE
jgi:hypothetical protein